jgi:hypothetical protein
MTVQAPSACVIAIADATPGVSQFGFHIGAEPFVYADNSHLWVRGSGIAVIAK